MERDDLVVRTTDLTDRRVLRIHLTKTGRHVRDPVLNVVDRVITEVFAGIPPEGIAQTKKNLRQVLANAHQDSM
jgi:DNA-binding MarR family transcriptional regulator